MFLHSGNTLSLNATAGIAELLLGRETPFGEPLIRDGLLLEDLRLERFPFDACVEVGQRPIELEPRLILFVAGSSSATGSPVCTGAPGCFSSRSSFASTGLDRARSCSGTTVPDAVMTASIGPVVTMAVRIRARVSAGRIQPGRRTMTVTRARSGAAT